MALAPSYDAAISHILKERYSRMPVIDMARKLYPFASSIDVVPDVDALGKPIAGGLSGRDYSWVVYGEDNQGRSPNFAVAQDLSENGDTFKVIRFRHKIAKDIGVLNISDVEYNLGKNSQAAFLNSVDQKVQGLYRSMHNNFCLAMFRDGSGYRARIESFAANPLNAAWTDITVTQAADVHNLFMGEGLEFGTSRIWGSPVKPHPFGHIRIVRIDTGAGKFTIDRTAGETTIAAGDWIFGEGYHDMWAPNADGDMVPVTPLGLEAFCPDEAPTPGENFLSADRTVYTERYAGLRMGAKGKKIEDVLIDAAMELHVFGAQPDTFILHPFTYAKYAKSLVDKVVPINYQVSPTLTISALAFAHNGVRTAVVQDMACPVNKCYMLQKDMFKLLTIRNQGQNRSTAQGQVTAANSQSRVYNTIIQLRSAPKGGSGGGDSVFIRRDSADQWEARMGYYANLMCRAPSYCLVALLDKD